MAADVVIRGMEMPKGDPKEPTAVWIYPNGYVRVFAERGNNVYSAEAVPLPKGHGRIVDAAEILEKANNSPWFDGDVSELGLLLGSEVTTIVPAEGGTDDGN